MIINGRGYICKECKREMRVDDVTYYEFTDGKEVIKTKCCNAFLMHESMLAKNWVQRLLRWLCDL